MEGGAMRGLFTCGVIDVFLEQGIRFDGAALSTIPSGYHYNAALGIVVKDALAWKLDISGTPINAGSPTPAYGSTNVLADGASFLCAAPEVWTPLSIAGRIKVILWLIFASNE